MTSDKIRFKEGLQEQPVIDLQSFLINKGRGFTVSARFNDVGNGDSVYVFLDNPSDSGFDYDVVFIPRATGLIDFDVSFGATQNDGSTASANNLKSGSTRTFSGTAEKSTTGDTGTRPSHGTVIVSDFVPGGEVGVKVGGSVIGSVSFTIDQDSNKLIELNNQAGGSLSRMSVSLVVFEVDGTYKGTT
jgi:hypothetical protein